MPLSKISDPKYDPVKPVLRQARWTLFDMLTLGIPRKIAEAAVSKQIRIGLEDAAEIKQRQSGRAESDE